MQFGITVSNAGAFGDPRAGIELAVAAEKAGWDGFFTWDALPARPEPPPAYDPWVILSSIAALTERIRIGTCITVVPRYRVHLLARTLATLDVLSEGRLIFGVGIGDGPSSFDAFGEQSDARVRAEKLDEALEIMTRLWTGEEVTHRGQHFVVEKFALTASPKQQPRIPIWVGGDSPGAMRRAASWDGWIGPSANPLAGTPEDAVVVRRRLSAEGAPPANFDLAWAGTTSGSDDDRVVPYQRAGANWWIEVLFGSRDDVMRRVTAGPPRTGL